MGNYNLPERNCYFCENKFTPLIDIIFCKKCFDDPKSYQHECYAMEAYAKKLGKKNMYDLDEKELKEMPKLSDEEINVIRESIYGKN
tara:strand:- start:171 stop:431 length:261 start_codon:yes stop_codon:yes gene_type:complete